MLINKTRHLLECIKVLKVKGLKNFFNLLESDLAIVAKRTKANKMGIKETKSTFFQ